MAQIQARSQRTSRAAAPPPPSADALERAYELMAICADEFESRGLVRAERTAPISLQHRSQSFAKQHSDAATNPRVTHMFSLQKCIDISNRESGYLSHEPVLQQEFAGLAMAAMRSNSVRASIVEKAKKTSAGGQQTTRQNVGDVSGSWSSSVTSCALALAAGRFLAKERGVRIANPTATFSIDPSTLVDGCTLTGEGILPCSSRLLCHALPVRVCAHSLLRTMTGLAQKELNDGVIRQRAPHQADSLRVICLTIVDNLNGLNIWGSWCLLVYCLSDPRLRHLIQHTRINELDAAVAALFIGYGRSEITRRARQTAAADAAACASSTGSVESVSSEDEDDDTGGVLLKQGELALQARRLAATHTLSHKRKRAPLDSSSQNGLLLDYWAAAFGSEFVPVLKTLISQSKLAATDAAVKTLEIQGGVGISENALLVDIGARNAVRSSEAVSSLVVVSDKRVPKVVSWRARHSDGRLVLHTGMVRSSDDAANTAIHVVVPTSLQCKSAHTVALRSTSHRRTTAVDNESTFIPGAVESTVHLHSLQHGNCGARSRHHVQKTYDFVKNKASKRALEGSVDTTLTGICRGFIVFRAKIPVSLSQLSCGESVASKLQTAKFDAQGLSITREQSESENATLLLERPLDAPEPSLTPSSALGLGLQVNEELRGLFKGKTRSSACRHVCGAVAASETTEGVDLFDQPQALLTIVDTSIEFLESPHAEGNVLPNRKDSSLRTVGITLAVCGDTPTRAVDLVDALCDASMEAAAKHDASGALSVFFEAMAITHASAARASELNDVAAACCAGHVNSSVASAKRILIGDLNTRLYLTLWQVWRVGLSNVPRSFCTTPWSGTYGAGFDLGTSGGIGLKASSLTADQRNHGKLLMGQHQVDEWCEALAKAHFVETEPGVYAAVPVEARGVPHNAVPGLHAYLNDYVGAMERARGILGVDNARTVDSLQALPFGPFSERIAPFVAENADPTLSRRFRAQESPTPGTAFLVDSTCEELSIFRDPLVPRVAICSSHDNVFNQAQTSLTTVFGAAATIARHAITHARLVGQPDAAASDKVQLLHALLGTFHHGGAIAAGSNLFVAASCMVMLNVIFPSSFSMARPVISEAYAKAPSQCARAMRAQLSAGADALGLPLCSMSLSSCALAQARSFWAPFERDDKEINAWQHLKPLLEFFVASDGSYDNGLEDFEQLWQANERLLKRAAWCKASPDGHEPPQDGSPLEGVRSYSAVEPRHIVPIFIGFTDAAGDRVEARSSLLGSMPMAFSQVLQLLIASANMPVDVNAVHNFGGLVYRPSSSADILSVGGKPRSSKAVSPVGLEGDTDAFGSRAEKLVMCAEHREAWRLNLDLVRPLCVSIAAPLPDAVRARGCASEVSYIKTQTRELSAFGVKTKQSLAATASFERASLHCAELRR